jgi:hypothetical protein
VGDDAFANKGVRPPDKRNDSETIATHRPEGIATLFDAVQGIHRDRVIIDLRRRDEMARQGKNDRSEDPG